MTMEYWAKAPMQRDQTLLFYPTLDESISEDHTVRLLDEVLRGQNWSAWAAEYDGSRGQPPIPPWILAGVILYGLMRGIRSSRMLEYLCGHNIDYIWLAEGRTIDYSTICKFRTRFREPLKDLFRNVVKLAMRMGLVKLVEVAFDGTRVKANASRFQTWTAERLEAALKELETLFEQATAETEQTDAVQGRHTGTEEGSLPPELATAKARQAKLKELLAELQAADEARRKGGTDPQKNPAQMPKADPSLEGHAQQGRRLRSQLHAAGGHRHRAGVHRRLRRGGRSSRGRADASHSGPHRRKLWPKGREVPGGHGACHR